MTTKTKKATKAATAKATTKKQSKPAAVATPLHLSDPCVNGHKWDTEGDGVEHCMLCLADRKVIEKVAKKKVKKATSPKPTKAAKTYGKLSALDAAAQVLATSAEPLNAKQMIEAMTAKGLWTSPGGRTPHATLYTVVTMLPKARRPGIDCSLGTGCDRSMDRVGSRCNPLAFKGLLETVAIRGGCYGRHKAHEEDIAFASSAA
jgi:hypothetical protein